MLGLCQDSGGSIVPRHFFGVKQTLLTEPLFCPVFVAQVAVVLSSWRSA